MTFEGPTSCRMCGGPVGLAAEPRVGPAPRFIYRCLDRCDGETMLGLVIGGAGGSPAEVMRRLPRQALFALSRCCP